ncbi:MAG: oligosaccharide flippase family protein [Clostridia bacterium]|nr:oligosaccharide flippase family protein [Clostridia bacterium]
MNKYKKLLSDTVILGIGTFASKALVLLMMPLYTDCLSPSQYGTADLISQTANLLIPLACAGVCDGLFRFTLDSGADKPSVFRTSVRMLLISTLIFLVLSPILLAIDYFSSYAWLVIAYVLAANLHSVCAQYVRACDRPKLFALQGILNTATVISLNLLFLLVFDMGVLGYVLSVVLADTAVSIFLIIVAKLYRDLSVGKFSGELARRLVRYSLPMIPTTIFWWITNVSDRYIVTWMCGDAVNGIYSAAYKIPTLITLLCSVFYEAWQFSAVKDAEQKTKSSFFGQVFGYYSSLMFMGGAAVVLLLRVFVNILFADTYAGAWEYIPMLTAAAVFSALTTFMGSVYLVKKKSMMSFLTSMLGAVLNIGLNFALIPFMGAQGAAVATAFSYFVVFVVRTVTAQRQVSFPINYVRLGVNIILLVAECTVAILAPAYWYVYAGGIALVLLVINAYTLVHFVKGTLAQLRRRGRTTDK